MNRRELITAGLGLLGIGAPAAAVAKVPHEQELSRQLSHWRKTSAWVYWHAGEVPTTALFETMISCLERRFRYGRWKERYAFYVHETTFDSFYYAMHGDVCDFRERGWLLTDDTPCFRGIRLIGAPSISDELEPIQRDMRVPVNVYTEAFLADPQCGDPKAVVWARDIRQRI